MDYGIPSLSTDPAHLSALVPILTWHRYGRFKPAQTFYLFRSGRFDDRSIGGTLGFYVDDYRLESLWTRRKLYTRKLARDSWGAVVMPDFSLWRDSPRAQQIWNVYRSRVLACEWQAAGVVVAPNLSWSDEESYEYCFTGMPVHAPVVFCQARSLRARDRDMFRQGLRAAVERLVPRHVVFYGQARWLTSGDLPAGPRYTRLISAIDGVREVIGREVEVDIDVDVDIESIQPWRKSESRSRIARCVDT